MKFIVSVLLLTFPTTSSFLTPNHRQKQCSFILASTTEKATSTTSSDSGTIDDVDARVLQSLLNDNKLDADDVRRVMEQKKQQAPAEQQVEQEESKYSSEILKKLTDTKLFRKISVQAAEFVETNKLRVLNKLEQDLAVVLAVTSTIWDRATQNVARALPATRNSTTTTTTRLLTSAAPAGRAGAAVRSQRAFAAAKTKKQLKPPNVVNAAYQVRKELQAETSTPGYKTEPARKAIAAAAVSAYRIAGLAAPGLLKGAAETKKLAANLEENEVQKVENDDPMEATTSTTTPSNEKETTTTFKIDDDAVVVETTSFFVENDFTENDKDAVVAMDIDESTIFRHRLDACIADPQATWLTADVAAALPQIDYCVQETVAILARTRGSHSVLSCEILETACADIGRQTSRVVGNQLREYLLAENVAAEPLTAEEVVELEPMEAMIIADAQVENYVQQTATADVDEDDGSSVATAVVEIVSDEEDVMANNNDAPNSVREMVDEESSKEKEDSVLTTLALRSLDVLFLVLEKIVVVGVPRSIAMGQTAIQRIEGVKRKGEGTEGWTPVTTVKGRY